jgi:hypothetical protein
MSHHFGYPDRPETVFDFAGYAQRVLTARRLADSGRSVAASMWHSTCPATCPPGTGRSRWTDQVPFTELVPGLEVEYVRVDPQPEMVAGRLRLTSRPFRDEHGTWWVRTALVSDRSTDPALSDLLRSGDDRVSLADARYFPQPDGSWYGPGYLRRVSST